MEIENDKKMQEKIKYFLSAKTIGNKIIYYNECDSTQKEIRKSAEKKIENGTIVVTDYQTNGIGTKGRVWYTGENKNIAMTIILKPKCSINKLEGLSKKIAECMKKTIEELYKIPLEIKEPNDLMLNDKKICGILTEINTISGKINYLLISLGFNVNEDIFSKEMQNIATSLKKEYKKEFSREDIIKKFIEIFEKEIDI